ncbi:hypothetical protein PsorP6_007027 [Peronosclerospora sorghi]|uniref:Uncharacterized protein n=1 Tax=Peronosclerospora sorghi TaxID=230839 RepID=A0ACC0W892_9STRA|nr:hypothetical protein PsorP6_007027 [Peronosclerospora sorghi]
MVLTQTCKRRPVFCFIGDSVTEQCGDPGKSLFVTNTTYSLSTVSIAVSRATILSQFELWILGQAMPSYSQDLESLNLSIQRLSVLLITPPCVTDPVRHNYRSNASAAKYAKTFVELAAADNVHVLKLHTYFNTTYPDETVRKTYFVAGLHFSEKGNNEVFKLCGGVKFEIENISIDNLTTTIAPSLPTFGGGTPRTNTRDLVRSSAAIRRPVVIRTHLVRFFSVHLTLCTRWNGLVTHSVDRDHRLDRSGLEYRRPIWVGISGAELFTPDTNRPKALPRDNFQKVDHPNHQDLTNTK